MFPLVISMALLHFLVFFYIVNFTLIIQGIQGNFILVCFYRFWYVFISSTTVVRHKTL